MLAITGPAVPSQTWTQGAHVYGALRILPRYRRRQPCARGCTDAAAVLSEEMVTDDPPGKFTGKGGDENGIRLTGCRDS